MCPMQIQVPVSVISPLIDYHCSLPWRRPLNLLSSALAGVNWPQPYRGHPSHLMPLAEAKNLCREPSPRQRCGCDADVQCQPTPKSKLIVPKATSACASLLCGLFKFSCSRQTSVSGSARTREFQQRGKGREKPRDWVRCANQDLRKDDWER